MYVYTVIEYYIPIHTLCKNYKDKASKNKKLLLILLLGKLLLSKYTKHRIDIQKIRVDSFSKKRIFIDIVLD